MLVFSISGFLTFLQTSLFVIGYISKNIKCRRRKDVFTNVRKRR